MNRAGIIAVVLAIVSQPLASATSYSRPLIDVVISKNGRSFLKVCPAFGSGTGRELGVAYTINDDGEFEVLWRTPDWSDSGYLSDDGRFYVACGPGLKSTIAFYDRGRLLKQYELCDLIPLSAQQEAYGTDYWMALAQTKPNGFYGNSFHLVTIDKVAHSFDPSTGVVISREKDDGAKGFRELYPELAATYRKSLWPNWARKADDFWMSLSAVPVSLMDVAAGFSVLGLICVFCWKRWRKS